ncbi:MAG: class I SAM-dependent methyltransferase [Verrucomicrobia bacterium]|nr:class I SAM-dependent methyltransferase [Verrucomicrobiota bacterium]
MTTPETYIGNELEIFSHANNWRNYWASVISPYLGGTVLEVGAGIGATTKLLARPDIEWTCIEPDHEQAVQIRSWCDETHLSSVSVVTGTLQDLPSTLRFDTIIYIDVLEHIKDDRIEVNNAFNLINEGGNLIILVPAHQSLYSAFDRSIGHYRRYNRKQLEILKPNNAVQRMSAYLDSFGLLASLVNRLLLNSSMPTKAQVRFWDQRLVPLSRLIDRHIAYRLGKSLVIVWTKT